METTVVKRKLIDILKDKEEVNEQEKFLRVRKQELWAEYEEITRAKEKEVSRILDRFGFECKGYTNSSDGPFSCSTIYLYITANEKYEVLYNCLERGKEIAPSGYFHYTEGDIQKTVKVSDNNCFLIKDHISGEYTACSNTTELLKILREKFK